MNAINSTGACVRIRIIVEVEGVVGASRQPKAGEQVGQLTTPKAGQVTQSIGLGID